MKYRFGNYEVECDEYDLENIADKVFEVERKRTGDYWQSVVKIK